MSYSVVTNQKGLFDIYEKESDVTIQLDMKTEKDARDICRKLNLGSGFNGWTPSFVAEKMDVKETEEVF
jgi:pyruvate kinase